MITRTASAVFAGVLVIAASAAAGQEAAGRMTDQYVDPAGGLSLEQAIAQARQREPSLRAARSDVDVARGLRMQAALRANPSISFERRQEPGGTDNQTMVTAEWPLELFNRTGRIEVADREIAAARFAAAERERLVTAEVRAQYGDAMARIRELAVLDEIVAAARRQHELVQSRVEQGASPPLERDLIGVERRRLESEQLLAAGRTEAAFAALRRVLGMEADAPLKVRDILEDVVLRESSLQQSLDVAPKRLEQRPDLREAAARIDLAEARIDRAGRAGRFDVTLFGSYARMDAGFPQRGFGPAGALERVRGLFHYVAAGAMVSVPILDRNQGETAAARAERASAAARYDAARLAAGAELAAARAQDARARQAVGLYAGATRTLARQNVSVVAQSYELGRVTVFDVLAEQRRYLEVERAYTDALRSAFEARTALDRALGGLQ